MTKEKYALLIAALTPSLLVGVGSGVLFGWPWGLVSAGLMTFAMDLCSTRAESK